MIGVLRALGRQFLTELWPPPAHGPGPPEPQLSLSTWCYLSSGLPLFMPGGLPRLSLFFPGLSVRFSVLCKHLFLSALEHPLFPLCLVSFTFVLLTFLPSLPASSQYYSLHSWSHFQCNYISSGDGSGWMKGKTILHYTHTHAPTQKMMVKQGLLMEENICLLEFWFLQEILMVYF